MEINIPEIVAEVTAAFMAYEKALLANDVDMIDELFWDDERRCATDPAGRSSVMRRCPRFAVRAISRRGSAP